MSDRPTDGGELNPGETYIAYSGHCRITRASHAGTEGKLLCVAPDHGYVLVAFETGEEHAYDRVQWKNKDGSHSGGFVIRTADGDAHLMPHLFEQVCEVIGAKPARSVAPNGELAPKPRPAIALKPRPVRVVNVKGINKPEQRSGVVYVGRKFAGWPEHELHNPFKPREGEPVGECLRRYRAKLLSRLTLGEDLSALWEECGRGAKPLGCWCTNATAGDGAAVVCHAQVLAELLHERFGAK